MTTQKMIVVLTGLGLATLAALVYFASLGSQWAYALLLAAWSIVCVCIGWGLAYVQARSMSDREQKNFIENAKENMALVGAIQSVQNRQNSSIMQQLGQAARLPGDNGAGLLIDNVLFDELE